MKTNTVMFRAQSNVPIQGQSKFRSYKITDMNISVQMMCLEAESRT